jgi:hypothetical protein
VLSRRKETADAGIATLAIARAGKQAKEFDQFVTLLTEQIQRARSQPSPGATA